MGARTTEGARKTPKNKAKTIAATLLSTTEKQMRVRPKAKRDVVKRPWILGVSRTRKLMPTAAKVNPTVPIASRNPTAVGDIARSVAPKRSM
jgi:hypothetical protein